MAVRVVKIDTHYINFFAVGTSYVLPFPNSFVGQVFEFQFFAFNTERLTDNHSVIILENLHHVFALGLLVKREKKRLCSLSLFLHKPKLNSELSQVSCKLNIVLDASLKSLSSPGHEITIITSHTIKKRLIIFKSTLDSWIVESKLVVPLNVLELPPSFRLIDVKFDCLFRVSHLDVVVRVTFSGFIIFFEEIRHVHVEVSHQVASFMLVQATSS